MATRNRKLPKLPKAPAGPPPELPSESKAKLAPLQPPGGLDTPKGAGVRLNATKEPKSPLRKRWPFLSSTQLMTLPEAEMDDMNLVEKIKLFWEDREKYRGIIREYGEHHKHYRDKEDYGNQEENKAVKGRKAGGQRKKGSGGTFYN